MNVSSINENGTRPLSPLILPKIEEKWNENGIEKCRKLLKVDNKNIACTRTLLDRKLCEVGQNGDLENIKDEEMRALYKITSSLGLSSPEPADSNECFYGVFIPHDFCNKEDVVHVYTDKKEALKVMKQSKKARFKQFRSYREAADFAKHGAEVTPSSSSQVVGGEKPVSFKGPKSQDLVLFRKAIEAGDLETVQSCINENPRYLVSSGDTPSLLQEGCRYNALHVAAMHNQPAIAELILNSIESLQLLARLYEDSDEESLRARSDVLLDLYLNTPDKSANETPLHFASKHGAVGVVELLTSYKQCQRNTVNRFGASPKDVVCQRATEGLKNNKDAIMDLLEERFFLPVLRYEDNSMPARLGEPFSPTKPLNITSSPLSPRLEIPAYAGPMSRDQVSHFIKKWQTPPKLLRHSELRLVDPEKGHERFARSLAHDFKIPWREYWSFLDTYVDLSSEEGLGLLEAFLSRRFEETLQGVLSPKKENGEDDSNESPENALSPISDLCAALQACSLNDDGRVRETPKKVKRPKDEKKLRRDRKTDEIIEKSVEDGHHFSSLLVVEHSCQVFGKRISNSMVLACSTVEVNTMGAENLRDSLEPEVKHLQSLVAGYMEDPRFQAVNFNVVHRRVAGISVAATLPLLTPSEKNTLMACLRAIAIADGTVSDDEDILYSSRRDDNSSLGAVLKAHFLCLTECLLTEMNNSKPVKCGSVQNETECQALWAQSMPCNCDWEPYSHQARARAIWRRKQKLVPRILSFKTAEESSVEDSWISCEEPAAESEESFATPPSSPTPSTDDDELEETFSLPDTFIYPGDRPSKTDLAVLDAISTCNITPASHPAIYRWRHLVKLHQDNIIPCGQVAPSPGAWHRRRLVPSTPRSNERSPLISAHRGYWERLTGSFSPSPHRITFPSPSSK